MKKLKNKFILIVISIIIFIIWIEIYKIFLVENIDRNSYITLIEWKWLLNNKDLILEKKEKLKALDKIKTIWENSLAIIKWWDWSITRLWGNSILVVKENKVDQNLLNIKISFKLEKWKSWSDVISFIWEDSYFHQSFADTTAAVRWTIYEVNLEKDYIYVESHEVELTKKTWEKKIIPEKKPFIISKFSFEEILKFLKKYKDKTWQELNKNLDKKFYLELKQKFDKISSQILKQNKKLQEKINNIWNLTEKQKQDLQKQLLKNYQKLNFISVNDIENYKNKLNLKQDLIKISDWKTKENLVITSLYDIKNLEENKQFTLLAKNIEIIWKNISTLKNSNIDLNNYLDINILKNIEIPEWLKDSFYKNFENIKNNLNLKNLNMDNNLINSLKNSTNQSINWVKENLENIKNLIK